MPIRRGIRKCIVPSGNSQEAAIIDGMTVIPVESLTELVDYLSGISAIEPEYVDVDGLLGEAPDRRECDFSEVRGMRH